MIINFSSAIALVVWKDDRSKTEFINAFEKILHSIIDIFVLLKDTSSCCKKDKNEKYKEPEKENENKALEEGKQLLNTISDRQRIIKNLETLATAGTDNKDPRKAKEASDAKTLLESIREQEQNVINKN